LVTLDILVNVATRCPGSWLQSVKGSVHLLERPALSRIHVPASLNDGHDIGACAGHERWPHALSNLH